MAKVLVYANRADKLAELVSFARTLGSECLALACGPELPEGFGSSGADATILLKGSSARPEDRIHKRRKYRHLRRRIHPHRPRDRSLCRGLPRLPARQRGPERRY